jgi:hypothetical protein
MKKAQRVKAALKALKAIAEAVGDCGAKDGTKDYEKDLYKLRSLCCNIAKAIEWHENGCNDYENL